MGSTRRFRKKLKNPLQVTLEAIRGHFGPKWEVPQSASKVGGGDRSIYSFVWRAGKTWWEVATRNIHGDMAKKKMATG